MWEMLVVGGAVGVLSERLLAELLEVEADAILRSLTLLRSCFYHLLWWALSTLAVLVSWSLYRLVPPLPLLKVPPPKRRRRKPQPLHMQRKKTRFDIF